MILKTIVSKLKKASTVALENKLQSKKATKYERKLATDILQKRYSKKMNYNLSREKTREFAKAMKENRQNAKEIKKKQIKEQMTLPYQPLDREKIYRSVAKSNRKDIVLDRRLKDIAMGKKAVSNTDVALDVISKNLKENYLSQLGYTDLNKKEIRDIAKRLYESANLGSKYETVNIIDNAYKDIKTKNKNPTKNKFTKFLEWLNERENQI